MTSLSLYACFSLAFEMKKYYKVAWLARVLSSKSAIFFQEMAQS